MGIIVFFFIVVCVIVSTAKGASKANARGRQGQAYQQRQYRQSPYQQGQYQQRPYVPPKQGQYTATQTQTVRNGNQAGQVHTKVTSATETSANQKQQSTLEYLEKKAREDQLEHQREMREDAVRRERASEGRNMGGRYMSGDPVPQGAAICKCGYCGAENIVSAYSRSGYKCYFCWENIN
ncbi:MAG: hypothetical protein IJX86_02060 [Lachnospiraceae bacterium]|nr:hypothetical protein [Lachnospiraceae bacterium]